MHRRGNIVNTIMTNGQSLEKYTSHTLFEMVTKGLCVRVELETEQNCNILTPSTSGYSSITFSFSWAAQPRALMAASPQSGAGSHAGILSPNLWLQLTELPVTPGYIIVWLPPASCGRHICTQLNPSTVKIIPWYLRPDAPVIYTGAFLIWQLGRVWGQYVTLVYPCERIHVRKLLMSLNLFHCIAQHVLFVLDDLWDGS